MAAIAAHIYVAWGSSAPIFYEDEVGYIANAQSIAGVGEPRDLSGSSYYLGWSLLLVPLWFLTTEPAQVYAGALALSVVCAVGVIVPLTSIARSCGLSTPLAVISAAAISVAPARLVMSNFALAENFISLLVACTVVLALRLHDSPGSGRAVALIAASSYLFFTHARTAPILIASLVWIVVIMRKRWKAVALSVLTAIAISGVGLVFYRMVTTPLYGDAEEGRESEGLERLLALDVPAAITSTTGQVWYIMTAWYGLALLGLVVVSALVIREVRSRSIGVGSWAALAFLGVLAVSVIWIAAAVHRGDLRFDIYAYGRYLDSILFVAALVGLARLFAGLRRTMFLWWISASSVISVAFMVVVYWQVPSGPDTWWVPLNVAGLIQFDWPQVQGAVDPPWIAATFVSIALTLAVGFLSWRAGPRIRVAAILVVMLVIIPASGLLAEVRTMRPMYDPWYSSFTLREDVKELWQTNPSATISFDVAGLTETGGEDSVSRNAYQFWLAPNALPVFDSTKSAVTTEYVIARSDWPLAQEMDAMLVATDHGLFDNALWRVAKNPA